MLNLIGQPLKLYYDGARNLKGVIGGNSYPIFWMDVSDPGSLFRREDKLQAIEAAEKEDIKEYCEGFYEEYDGFIFRPFIADDPGGVLSKQPSWYEKYQKTLFANFENRNERYKSGAKRNAESGASMPEDAKNAAIRQLKEKAAESREQDE